MSDSNEERLLSVLERLPLPVVISSAENGVILWVNARNMGLVGATDPQQIVGRVLLEFIRPEQHAIALRDVEAVARGESPPPVVYHLRRLDGGTSDAQIASMPIRYGDAPAILSLISDVTERERTLRELEESEERFRILVDSSPDGIVVCVGDEMVFANRTMLVAMRVEGPDGALGRSMYDFIDPAFHKPVREAQRSACLKRDLPANMEVVVVCADGSRFPATMRIGLVRWHGEPAIQTIFDDITKASA